MEIVQGFGGAPQAFGDLNTIAETGLRQFQLQRGQALLPGELAAQPVDLENKQALARYHNAQAINMEAEDADIKRAGELMSRLGQEGLSSSQAALKASQSMMGVAPRTAMKVAEYGIRMAHGENAAERNSIDKRREELAVKIQGYQDIATRAPWVTDQAGLDALNDYFVKTYKEPPPWGSTPYSPKLMESIQDVARTQTQRDLNKWREDQESRLERQNERAEEMRRMQLQIAQHYRASGKGKDGEKVLGEPPKGRMEFVERLAVLENPGVAKMKDAELEAYSRYVALEAEKIRRQNPSRDFDSIARDVHKREKGRLLLLKNLQDESKKDFRFVGPGDPGSMEEPMTLKYTQDRQFNLPPELRQSGMWYKNPEGGVAMWNEEAYKKTGKGWVKQEAAK